MDSTIETMEIEGFEVQIDTSRTKSWKAFKLLQQATEADQELDQFKSMIELMEFATDATEEKIVEHLGGDEAPYLDVVRLVSEIVSGCYPKN